MTKFGNITTDPRLIQLKGEKMVFTCSTKDKMLNPKKSYRKFATIMKLNRVEDEKTEREFILFLSEELNVIHNYTAKGKPINDEDARKDRPKRSLDVSTKKECACDCNC